MTDAPAPAQVLRWAGLQAERWANGAGVTRTIASSPPDESGSWTWRISIADLDVDAPFSTLPGVQRVFVLAEGDGVHLTIDDVPHDLRRGDLVRFSGERRTACRLSAGPVRAVNVMVRPATVACSVMVLRGTRQSLEIGTDETVLVLCLSAPMTVTDDRSSPVVLEPRDGLRLDGPCVVDLAVEDAAVLVSLRHREPAAVPPGPPRSTR